MKTDSAATQFRQVDQPRTGKAIRHVEFRVTPDTDPDLSYLGVYSDKPDAKGHIDRKERDATLGGKDYRYFNVGTGEPEYIEADYARMEKYNAGEWQMTFCDARAEVVVNGVIQVIRSGGLGGVESDSGPAYYLEIRDEQLKDLALILEGLGFTDAEIAPAIAKCKSDVE